MIQTTDFTIINGDVNGKPGYVCSYKWFINQLDTEKSKELSKVCKPFKFFVEYEYQIALKKAKELWGKKFDNKQYGGGIVFSTYNLQNLCNKINELVKN